jgi:hypothetical protein
MKSITIIMGTIAGLSLAAPAAAQWGHDRNYGQQFQAQIDAGVSRGTISRRENADLRAQLGRLLRLEQRFSANGINGREHSILMQRSTSLAKDIRTANRSYNRRDERAAWNDGRDERTGWNDGRDERTGWNDGRDERTGWNDGRNMADMRFDGPVRGDRFAGDARIGQRAPARMLDMPVQYRAQYVDNDRVYYGYDNGRIYQIDRQSQLILALLDMAR